MSRLSNSKKKIEVYNKLMEEIRALREKKDRTYEEEKNLYNLEYALKNYFYNNIIEGD